MNAQAPPTHAGQSRPTSTRRRGRRVARVASVVLVAAAACWLAMTAYVEREPAPSVRELGDRQGSHRAVVIYAPDPFYDLDRQVAEAVAGTLAPRGWETLAMSTSAAERLVPTLDYDLLVVVANTYNLAPDRNTRRLLGGLACAQGQPAVLLTLGAGTTARARSILEHYAARAGLDVLASVELWSWAPNEAALAREAGGQPADLPGDNLEAARRRAELAVLRAVDAHFGQRAPAAPANR